MIQLPEKALRPTMYFIGVTTGQSSIMRVFPIWAKELGLDAVIKGIDLPIHAPQEDYRAVAEFIRDDPLSLGALVTTHKIDMYNAALDLFDYVDPYAQRFGELSSLSKKDGQFCAHAKDPISSGLALDAFVPKDHWEKTGGQVCVLGAGGSALAISAYLANAGRHGDDIPERIHLTNRSAPRLAEAVRILEYLDVPMSFHLCKEPGFNDRIVESLPAGSLVINATGLGKDRPGSPLTDECKFPRDGKDFIILRLTGKFYTEPSDATGNACIDMNTLRWSEKIVEASGIDGDKLPEIVPSTTVAGEGTRWAAEQTGLRGPL